MYITHVYRYSSKDVGKYLGKQNTLLSPKMQLSVQTIGRITGIVKYVPTYIYQRVLSIFNFLTIYLSQIHTMTMRIKIFTTVLQSIRTYTLAGFEPRIFCSGGRRDDHYTHMLCWQGKRVITFF
jgi:hypothetical protein